MINTSLFKLNGCNIRFSLIEDCALSPRPQLRTPLNLVSFEASLRSQQQERALPLPSDPSRNALPETFHGSAGLTGPAV